MFLHTERPIVQVKYPNSPPLGEILYYFVSLIEIPK